MSLLKKNAECLATLVGVILYENLKGITETAPRMYFLGTTGFCAVNGFTDQRAIFFQSNHIPVVVQVAIHIQMEALFTP